MRGFTLIELVVVLAILAGLTVAFPIALEHLQPERQLYLHAQRIAVDLRRLRTDAMTHHHVTSITAAANSHAYTLGPESTRSELPDVLELTLYPAAAAAPVQQLHFFPDGSATGGFVQLSREGHLARVHIAAFTGQVSVE